MSASDSFYSKENMSGLIKSIEDIKNGKKTLKEHELIEADS